MSIVTPAPRPAPLVKASRAPAVALRSRPVSGGSKPEAVSKGEIAAGDASFYGYPPCGDRGAAMLFYTWGKPFVQVTVRWKSRSVVATVCDNGPHVSGRVVDLSGPLFSQLCGCDGSRVGILHGVRVYR